MADIEVRRFGAESELWDADHDTGVQVEETTDDDTIRFDAAGSEIAQITSSGFTLEGTQVIDETNTEAFLVRKDGDSGDIVTINTANLAVGGGNTLAVENTNLVGSGNQVRNLYSNVTLASGTQSAHFRAMHAQVTASGSTVSTGALGADPRAFHVGVSWNSTGAATALSGLQTSITSGGSGIAAGTVTTAIANRAFIGYGVGTTSGSITDAYAFQASQPPQTSGTNTITTYTAFYAENVRQTGITNAYAFQSTGGSHLFGDDVLIDGSRDTVQLTVQGNATQTSELSVWEDSAGQDQITFGVNGSAVFNEQGNTADFRIESDQATHLFFVDGSENAVGFNTDDPTFIRAGSTKPSVFGVLKDDNSASQNGFFALASNTVTRSSDVSFLKCRGTWDTKLSLGNNDVICNLGFEGHDGDDFIRPAMIRATVDGAVSANVVPVELLFLVGSTNGGSNPSIRLRSNGLVNFGGNRVNPQISFNSINGEATFNEQGNAADFRVEGDTDTHLIFADGSADFVGISTNTPRSVLEIGGSMGMEVETITATDTLDQTNNVVLCDATSGAITVNLPAAGIVTNRVYRIKKIDTSANAVTVDPSGSQTIDGATTAVLSAAYDSIDIVSDGSNWYIL